VVKNAGWCPEPTLSSEGYKGVPEEVWGFHIGGYQVCHKWLKDRKGRMLSDEDIAHYQKIIVSLNESIRIMAEIDEIIEAHGGWPDAFQTVSVAGSASPSLARVKSPVEGAAGSCSSSARSEEDLRSG